MMNKVTFKLPEQMRFPISVIQLNRYENASLPFSLSRTKMSSQNPKQLIKEAIETFGIMLYWHDKEDHVDESWWESAREILAQLSIYDIDTILGDKKND
jgi:hypothetical protein